MSEVNNVNNATNVRVKLAYLIYVAKKKDACDAFYEKGLRECKRCPVLGLAKMEQKLFDKLKKIIHHLPPLIQFYYHPKIE